MASITVGGIVAKLDADARKFSAGIDTARGSLGRMGGVIGSIAKQAAGFALGMAGFTALSSGFSAVKGAAIGMNASLETSTLQFETLLGSASKAERHVAGLFDFAAKTPFETGPIIEASRSLLTFGFEARESQKALALVGDAAAGVSQPISEVAFWYGRAVSAIKAGQPFGEAAMRLQEMGIVTAEGRMELERLTDSGAGAGEMIAALDGQFGRLTGGMEKQAGSWAGLTSTISDNLSMLTATAFLPFFEVLKSGAGFLADFLQSSAAESWAVRIQGAIAGAVNSVVSFGTGVYDTVTAISSDPRLVGWFNYLVSTAARVGAAVIASFTQLASSIGPTLLPLFTSLQTAVAGLFGPAVVAGIVAFIGHATALATTVLPPIIQGVTDLLNWLNSSPAIFETVSASIASFTEGWIMFKALNLGALFVGLAAPIMGIVAPIVAVVAALAAGALAGQFIVDNFGKYFATAQQLAISFASGVLSVISSMLNGLALSLAKVPVIGLKLAKGLNDAAQSAGEGVTALGQQFAALEPAANRPITSITESVGNLTGNITKAITGVAPVISDTLTGAFNLAGEAGKAVISSLGDFGPAASKAGAEAATGLDPAKEATQDTRGEFEKMVQLFNHANPKIQIDADEAYGRVERVSDDYLGLVRSMDTNPALVNLDPKNAQAALAALGADLQQLDNKNLNVDADTRAALATVQALPEPIATRTLVIQAVTEGSPRKPFTEYWSSYAPNVMGDFLSGLSNERITLANEVFGVMEDGTAASAQEIATLIDQISIAQQQLADRIAWGIRDNFDTATGRTTDLGGENALLGQLGGKLEDLSRAVEAREAAEARGREDSDSREHRRHSETLVAYRSFSSGLDRLTAVTEEGLKETREINAGWSTGRYSGPIASSVSSALRLTRGTAGF